MVSTILHTRGSNALARELLNARGMCLPRQIIPGSAYMLTRRCTQRQFLMRPDPETNNAFIYCLADAAQRTEMIVLLSMAEANHHHTEVFDRYGRLPEFMEHFHKMFARSQNVLRGREENFWAAEEPCVVRLLDRETAIAKLIYIASNPVKDGLVERAHHWPGVNGYVNLVSGRPLRARRPRHFFRGAGKMPESIELKLTIPEEIGRADEVIAEVRAGVQAVERAAAEERKRTGARVLGRKTVLQQSWKATPRTIKPRSKVRPRFAGMRDALTAAVFAYRAFVEAYRDARRCLLARLPAVFPVGTYRLAPLAGPPTGPSG